MLLYSVNNSTIYRDGIYEKVQVIHMINYLYIIGTILFTLYGQVILKWQVSQVGAFPDEFFAKVMFLLSLLLNPWVISAFASAFLASLCWMVALKHFELSYAYPFTSLSFFIILILGAVLFHESITLPKVIGMVFIVIGVIISSQGYRQ